MPAPYQSVSVDLPCGHTYVGDGPKRQPSSTTPPASTCVRGTCFCGQDYAVVISPVLQVVGYKGRVWRPIGEAVR